MEILKSYLPNQQENEQELSTHLPSSSIDVEGGVYGLSTLIGYIMQNPVYTFMWFVNK